jgi:hypothetical protein
MGSDRLEILTVMLAFVAVTWAAFRLRAAALAHTRARLVRLLPRSRRVLPQGRPLEDIAEDARRLGVRYHHPQRGSSFVKLEAVRHAYDKVLAEACAALGVDHLLGVLEPGEELDGERARVENVLWLAGLRIDEAA